MTWRTEENAINGTGLIPPLKYTQLRPVRLAQVPGEWPLCSKRRTLMYALGSHRLLLIATPTRADAPAPLKESLVASLSSTREMLRIKIRSFKNNCTKRWTSRPPHPPVTRTEQPEAQADLRQGSRSPLKGGCE